MKTLIVDDNDVNLYLLRSLLVGNGHSVIEASNGEKALEELQGNAFDLIISDILMPGMDGFSFCREVKKHPDWLKIPFIFYTATYTGPQDEEFSREIGADRFVIKPCEPDELLRIIEDTVRKAATMDAAKPVTDKNEEDILKLYNQRLVRKLEQKMLEAEQEVGARREAEEALRRSESLLSTTQRISRIGGWEWDIDRQEMFWTEETYLIHGFTKEDLQNGASNPLERSLQCYVEEDREKVSEAFQQCIEQGIPYELECGFINAEGQQLCVRTAGIPVFTGERIIKVDGYIQDFTERKQAEIEQDHLKNLLLQSQKLESIGQLAGGVAHDFNNILTVIQGYSEAILNSLPATSVLRSDVDEILKASQRAANLTRQLLIFSRKHVVQPQVMDINQIVKELKRMLGRLIGEHITFIIEPSNNLGCIKADPGQIEQVIMNLVINARDAMPEGGRLTVSTSNEFIDSESSALRPNLAPGMYVVLTVSDTGCGMSKEIQERIFEPFFTTKEKGRGTGLGLSTVYGIVIESGGIIEVESALGHGTVFRVYFPFTAEMASSNGTQTDTQELRGGQELILIAEDEPPLRVFIAKILGQAGYRTVVVDSGLQALELIEQENLVPDLVLTDVVMPDMNGTEMIGRLLQRIPGQKFLYMSGYSDAMVVQHQIVNSGLPLIQKPFTQKDLVQRIQQLLKS
jgi:signal transduction histidine kinase/DNA-binding response OmpR family regulator